MKVEFTGQADIALRPRRSPHYHHLLYCTRKPLVELTRQCHVRQGSQSDQGHFTGVLLAEPDHGQGGMLGFYVAGIGVGKAGVAKAILSICKSENTPLSQYTAWSLSCTFLLHTHAMGSTCECCEGEARHSRDRRGCGGSQSAVFARGGRRVPWQHSWHIALASHCHALLLRLEFVH